MDEALLTVKDLQSRFYTARGTVKAVDGISLQVDRGQTLGVVGESGSGKTTIALSILGLLPDATGKVVGGHVIFRGQDLLKMDKRSLRAIRGKKIGMIFQDPMTSLNPVFRVGHQVAEVIRAHEGIRSGEALARTEELLKMVGLPGAADRLRDFPHEFSGGMRQRIIIAMALSGKPDLIIADEPTTALDVTVQAQILELLRDLKERMGSALILISHDLGVIAENADLVAVMYAGKIVERAETESLFGDPLHPYTRGLMMSVISLGRVMGDAIPIKGQPPSLIKLPAGCSFHPRCDYARERCLADIPELSEVMPGRWAACHYAGHIGWRDDRPAEVKDLDS